MHLSGVHFSTLVTCSPLLIMNPQYVKICTLIDVICPVLQAQLQSFMDNCFERASSTMQALKLLQRLVFAERTGSCQCPWTHCCQLLCGVAKDSPVFYSSGRKLFVHISGACHSIPTGNANLKIASGKKSKWGKEIFLWLTM